MVSCISEGRFTSQTTLNFSERSCPSTMTLRCPDTQEGGRPWSWLSQSEFSRSREFIHLKRVATDPQVILPKLWCLSSECKRRSHKKKHKQLYPNHRVPPPNASEGLRIINELPITILVSTHMIMFHGNEIIAQLHPDDRR